MRLKEWAAFVTLGLIWGSSFLWIKIAVQEIGPFMLAGIRLLLAVLGLLVVLRLQRPAIPRDRRTLLACVVVGIINTGIPFVLIPWGEKQIASSLASILNGTVPLFTIVIAHFWLHDEKITLGRLGGLVVGFVGVIVLVSRDIGPEGLRGDVVGQFAVLAASASYATGITFARRHLRGLAPVVQSLLTLAAADAFVWILSPAFERPLQPPALPATWIALLWLGILGSCIAYLLFFYLINSWGPTRASLVTYVFPVIGLILGIIFLNESADWWLLFGSALVVAGILVVNARNLGLDSLVRGALAGRSA